MSGWRAVLIDSPDSDGPLVYGPFKSDVAAALFADAFNAVAWQPDDDEDKPFAYVVGIRPPRLRAAMADWSVT